MISVLETSVFSSLDKDMYQSAKAWHGLNHMIIPCILLDTKWVVSGYVYPLSYQAPGFYFLLYRCCLLGDSSFTF